MEDALGDVVIPVLYQPAGGDPKDSGIFFLAVDVILGSIIAISVILAKRRNREAGEAIGRARAKHDEEVAGRVWMPMLSELNQVLTQGEAITEARSHWSTIATLTRKSTQPARPA